MRILHVTDFYLPRLGGIEIQVHDLAAHQRAAGHDATVVTSTPGPAYRAVPVTRLPSLRGVPTRRALAELARTVSSGRFDVVHAHTSLLSPLAWAAIRTARAADVPTVVTMHSMTPPTGLAPRLIGLLDVAAPGVTWTAVSAAAGAALGRALAGQHVSVLPNAVDPLPWRPLRTTSTLHRPMTIVSVMRMTHRKRPLELARILTEIRHQVPAQQPLRAVLVGSGPLAATLRRRLRRHAMDSWVTLPGRLQRSQIQQLFTHADVYLAPATVESFGIAALEARCAGLPVVAMARGGVGDFITDGVEGILVGSDREMAYRTARLLTRPRQLRSMQQHNRATSPSTTWHTVVPLTVETYLKAGARVGNRPSEIRLPDPMQRRSLPV